MFNHPWGETVTNLNCFERLHSLFYFWESLTQRNKNKSMSQMWDNEIMAATLKHIFRKHIWLDGDNNWGLNSHDSEKVKRRVYPTLRMVYSWVLKKKEVESMTKREILWELIIYMKTDHPVFYNECMLQNQKC